MKPMAIIISYLIYILVWEVLILGGCTYLVFWKGASPWWFVLAVLLSCASYGPEKWAKLVAP